MLQYSVSPVVSVSDMIAAAIVVILSIVEKLKVGLLSRHIQSNNIRILCSVIVCVKNAESLSSSSFSFINQVAA